MIRGKSERTKNKSGFTSFEAVAMVPFARIICADVTLSWAIPQSLDVNPYPPVANQVEFTLQHRSYLDDMGIR
jgi:hypothetical protein